MTTVWCKYRIEFALGGYKKGAYLGDTKEELHHAIDSDKRLDGDEGIRNILKYGYFGEFIGNPYITIDYVIDNCMHFMWTVREQKLY